MSTFTPLQKAFLALQKAESRADAAEAELRAPVAIVGLACRAPGGVLDANTFWELLSAGRDAIAPVPQDRWDHEALYDPDPAKQGRIATRNGGFVEGIDQFDPEFFGISPREADGMDPQQRMLLEVCWEALENAGQAPDQLQRSPTGVYIGAAGSDYANMQMQSNTARHFDAHFASGVAHSVLSGRVSYLLGLQGPSVTIDTACSSSLVAVHMACQALRAGECRLALGGGVNLILSPETFVALSQARMLAPDGRCKTFDAAADGFGRSEGCAVVALKLLADAEASGDRVLAVIRGSAVNQDGPSSGLTVPNGPAQEAVIRAALRQARIEPRQVGFVEAHGTGTELGDPLEMRALGAVFAGERTAPLLVGSVKTNIGHLEAAAGAIGLVKLVLSLQHGTIPKHLHFNRPSPHIAWDDLPVRTPRQTTPWPLIDGRQIGGVSSFGFSGTNVHVVVEAAPLSASAESASRAWLVPLSAQNADALARLARNCAEALTSNMRLADIVRTLGAGRMHHAHLAVIEATSIDELRAGLSALAMGADAANVKRALAPRGDPPRIAFLFSGQGAQYPGMGAGLYETAPAFREAFDRCDEILTPLLGSSLRDSVLASTSREALEQTGLAQPALFAVEYALAEMWRTLGVTPVAVLGHSIGELVGACVAGAIDLPEALHLVAARGALMQSLPPGGAMAAVYAAEKRVAEAIAPFAATVSVAAVNGPLQTVISGANENVEQICQRLGAEGIKTQFLAVSHAFHSPLVEPIMPLFEREVAKTTFSTPSVRMISNVTGQRLNAWEPNAAAYWTRQLRQPVRFADGLSNLAEMRVDICLEVGPHPTLTAFANGMFDGAGPRAIPSLRRNAADWRSFIGAVGDLYLAGVDVDWRGLDMEGAGRPLSLPSSPFTRRRHWFRTTTVKPSYRSEHPLLGKRLRTALADIVQFEAVLDSESADFIGDHVVQGRTIMPGAGMIEMALSAGRRVDGERLSVEALMLPTPLPLEPGAPRLVQTLVRKNGARPASFEILSTPLDDEGAGWTLHAQGEYGSPDARQAEPPASLTGAREIDAASHYEAMSRRGAAFGDSLKRVRSIRVGDCSALGTIENVADDHYDIHPALIDGCLQIVDATLPDGLDQVFLPATIDRVTLLRAPEGPVTSQVLQREFKCSVIRVDILVNDARGVALAIEGLTLRPTQDAQTSDLYRIEWRPLGSKTADADWAPDPAELDAALGARLPSLAKEQGLPSYQTDFLALEQTSVQWIVRAFAALGLRPQPGERLTATGLSKALGVSERYTLLVKRYLAILAEAGVMRRDGDMFAVAAWPDTSRPIALNNTEDPRAILAKACGDHLADILAGRDDPLERLFPNGSSAIAEKLYSDAPEAKAFNRFLGETVARAVAQAPAGHRVRILEVGAGTGGSTAHIAPLLKDANVSYCFTDLGRSFLSRARDRFAKHSFMSFERLDLEADGAAQGFAKESFDIIVAANCVHATMDLEDSLKRLRALLAPGGLLLLLELTGFERWVDITFGLTEGWWRFTDLDVRPDYPLLDRQGWRRTLSALDFDVGEIGQPLSTSRNTLLAARKPLREASRKIALFGGPEPLRQALATALSHHGCTATTSEVIDASSDVIAYLGFLGLNDKIPIDAVKAALAPLCDAIKQLGAAGASGARLCIVTRGAADLNAVAPVHTTALGFVRTLALELGELRPSLIDLDPAVGIEQQAGALGAALLDRTTEQERALRKGAVFATRLARLRLDAPTPLRLQASGSGVIEDLSLVPALRPSPGPGQVEIRVTASGLNFRDVINALAMRQDVDPLGGECAGVVSAVGAGVDRFVVGDAVVATALGALATYVVADVDAVALRPRGLTDCQAAATPLAAMTAWHALVDVARLQPGQSVLIHAGAGGVGMAAMQIAKRLGARIFATGGDEAKRALLRDLGAERVFSSRTLEFKQELEVATAGQGVDVVLNSLAGEFIEASVRSLATAGVFVEIGKNEIWNEGRFHGVRPQARYVALDLSAMLVRDRSAWDLLFQSVMADLDSGLLAPPPVRVFPLARAAEAFDFMARARHVGKVVLTQGENAASSLDIDPGGLYVVTGGFSGLGLATAERLFDRGARGLALVGRSAPSVEAASKVAAWRAAGAEVQEILGDISTPAVVDDLFARIDAGSRPLRGMIHAAGILSDGALVQQDWDRFEPPLRAKVHGAWLLHAKTLGRRLDFFALYSSIAATFGSPGQANHSAANAFMDGLAQYRRERGLPTVSIGWGAWSEFGAAAVTGADAKAAAAGIGVITPKRGLDMLESLLAGAPPHLVVTPMNWPTYLSRWTTGAPAFFEDVAHMSAAPERRASETAKTGTDHELLSRLEAAAPSARHEVLAAFVAAAVQRVLGLTSDIDRRRPLNEMGIDSLLAVELRNRLGSGLGLTPGLPATLVFDCPTVEQLAAHLDHRLSQKPSQGEQKTPASSVSENAVASIDDLSEEEISMMFDRITAK
jgi:acyl transferase domain-containing protein/NADPH:quinone reductase-like Zn-dependent oxidoreductase/NAD(P)-dependent dehydrogenase (short-subunit alcohol dehydrogenase family)